MADLAAPLLKKTALEKTALKMSAEPVPAASAGPETGRPRASRQTLKTLRLKGLQQPASTVDATYERWHEAVVCHGPWAQHSPAKAPSNRRPLPTTTPPCRRPNAQRNRGRGPDDAALDVVPRLHPQADVRFQATDPDGDHEDLETAPDVRNAPPSVEINDAGGAASAHAGVRSTQSQRHCTQE